MALSACVMQTGACRPAGSRTRQTREGLARPNKATGDCVMSKKPPTSSPRKAPKAAPKASVPAKKRPKAIAVAPVADAANAHAVGLDAPTPAVDAQAGNPEVVAPVQP